MTYPITIKMKILEGVCHYTPSRVLDKNNMKQEEITDKMQKIPYQFHKIAR
jgi:hypothetical protein